VRQGSKEIMGCNMVTSQSVKWFRYGDRAEHDFQDESVCSCYLGKVYYVMRSRKFSGWPSSDKRITIAFSLQSARSVVEDLREKGSSWSICELPALVIAGKAHALIAATGSLIESTLDESLPPTGWRTLDQAASQLPCRSRSELLVARRPECGPAKLPFINHHSYRRGAGQPLGWRPARSDDDLAFLCKVMGTILCAVQSEPVLS
jgi:hypothetical protein